jgi:hypothetical protein
VQDIKKDTIMTNGYDSPSIFLFIVEQSKQASEYDITPGEY